MYIYLVIHRTYENTNAFFSTIQKAKEYIEKQKAEYPDEETSDVNEPQWRIIKLNEGKQFQGMLSDLFEQQELADANLATGTY